MLYRNENGNKLKMLWRPKLFDILSDSESESGGGGGGGGAGEGLALRYGSRQKGLVSSNLREGKVGGLRYFFLRLFVNYSF